LEFLKDYDINFQYHLGKANGVADALSRRPYITVNNVLALLKDFCEDFKKLELNIVTRETRSVLYTIEVQPTLTEEIRAPQRTNP